MDNEVSGGGRDNYVRYFRECEAGRRREEAGGDF